MLLNLPQLFKSFRSAGHGFLKALKEEQNLRIQVIAAFFIIILSFILKIKVWQFTILILVIFLVLILELMNSVIERLVDITQPRVHHYAAAVKDLMAAVVFLAALLSVVIFFIILGPYLWNYILLLIKKLCF